MRGGQLMPQVSCFTTLKKTRYTFYRKLGGPQGQTNVKTVCKYYGRVFGLNSHHHSPALCWHLCRPYVSITMPNSMSTSAHKTKVTDKQIFVKFDIGEFYEKLPRHFNFQLHRTILVASLYNAFLQPS